jgi:Methyltransferase domain
MYWHGIQGWSQFTPLYEQMVKKYAAGGTIVELGVWRGKSFVALLEYIKRYNAKIKAVAVDTWNCTGNEYPTFSAEDCSKMWDDFHFHLDKAGVANYENLVIHRMMTAEAAKLYEKESIDFVFIDADHADEGCYRDMVDWWPLIKSGGTMAGHDWSGGWVKHSVNKFVKEYNVTFSTNSDWDTWLINK